MTIDEAKQQIAQVAGVPVHLLNGETIEENITKAKALIAYKKEWNANRTKTTREDFIEFMQAQEGTQPEADPFKDLANLEMQYKANKAYPSLQDGGEPFRNGYPDGRSTQEQFSEWISKLF